GRTGDAQGQARSANALTVAAPNGIDRPAVFRFFPAFAASGGPRRPASAFPKRRAGWTGETQVRPDLRTARSPLRAAPSANGFAGISSFPGERTASNDSSH